MEGKELSFKHLPIAPQHLKQLPVEFKGRLVDQAEFQPIQSQFSSWFKHWQMGPQNHSKIPYYLHNDETTLSLSQIIFLYLLSTGISNTSLSTFHLQLTVKVLVSQSCLTLRVTPWTVAHQAPLSMGYVGCHFLLQGTFLTQGSNPGLLHCRQIL